MDIGFIGVGFMGRHMVKHIVNGGHKLTVFDLNIEATEEIQGGNIGKFSQRSGRIK